MKKSTASKPKALPGIGDKVRFITDQLGASRRDELYQVTSDTYGIGDEGYVAFYHPNQKTCPDWFYVEVDSKTEPGVKLYVGITTRMCEPLP
jgi:hypothetical protein